jgi:hypothetical protein
MQRRALNAPRNMPDVAIVSHRALIGRCAFVGSFVQLGSKPHFNWVRLQPVRR